MIYDLRCPKHERRGSRELAAEGERAGFVDFWIGGWPTAERRGGESSGLIRVDPAKEIIFMKLIRHVQDVHGADGIKAAVGALGRWKQTGETPVPLSLSGYIRAWKFI